MDPKRLAARKALRAALASWPDVPLEVAALVRAAPWRRRQAVMLYLVERRSLEETAAQLGVSAATVQRELREVYDTWSA